MSFPNPRVCLSASLIVNFVWWVINGISHSHHYGGIFQTSWPGFPPSGISWMGASGNDSWVPNPNSTHKCNAAQGNRPASFMVVFITTPAPALGPFFRHTFGKVFKWNLLHYKSNMRRKHGNSRIYIIFIYLSSLIIVNKTSTYWKWVVIWMYIWNSK